MLSLRDKIDKVVTNRITRDLRHVGVIDHSGSHTDGELIVTVGDIDCVLGMDRLVNEIMAAIRENAA